LEIGIGKSGEGGGVLERGVFPLERFSFVALDAP
jgi:hypothetical protein